MTARTWRDVWAARRPDGGSGIGLTDLLRADGYDTQFGAVDEQAWRAHVDRWIMTLRVTPGMSVYEIGCGAGAFLLRFHELGCRVGGLDLSPGLIEVARAVMPGGDFRVADAAEFTGERTTDVVVSSGVFMYFPSPAYARDVLRAMARAARHAVLVLDIPDRRRKTVARACRVAAVGGPDAYDRRYRGLEHQYYDRDEMASLLTAHGLVDVVTEDVRIAGYANAAYRFDLYGFVGDRR